MRIKRKTKDIAQGLVKASWLTLLIRDGDRAIASIRWQPEKLTREATSPTILLRVSNLE
jgi:hypothetical protein